MMFYSRCAVGVLFAFSILVGPRDSNAQAVPWAPNERCPAIVATLTPTRPYDGESVNEKPYVYSLRAAQPRHILSGKLAVFIGETVTNFDIPDVPIDAGVYGRYRSRLLWFASKRHRTPPRRSVTVQ